MATKHPIGTTLPTAARANHPQSPDHEGHATMSGRKYAGPPPLAGRTRNVGGGSMPNSKGPTPVAKPAVGRPNGGSFKPGKARRV